MYLEFWENWKHSVWFVLFVFFFLFFLLFFFFYLLFLFFLVDTSDSKGSREERGNHCFLLFHFHLLTTIHLVHRDFYHLFIISICNYQTDSWWDFFTFGICIFFAFSLTQLSRSYWLWQFKVTLWGFKFISNLHPSITKRTP